MTPFAEFERPAIAVVRVLGLSLLSGGSAAVAAFFYQSYARQRMPGGLAVLVGLGSVGIWLNTRTALSQFLGSGNVVPSAGVAFINVAAFGLGTLTAVGGAHLGSLAVAVFANSGAAELEGDVSRLVQAVGRFVTVELPETVADIDGYEPVAPETKAALSGETFRFPRGLTVAELRERLVSRIRDDYGVGHVDVDLAADGTLTYAAVGGRAAGIGPTLPPGTVAVAVRADPAFSASAGDLVQVWRRGPSADEAASDRTDDAREDTEADDDGATDSGRGLAERVARAEFRAAVGDVVTLALGEDEAADLDLDATYRLVTLPTEQRADREFSAQLRAADETVGEIVLADDSPLVGLPVGGLVAAVVAVRGTDGVETLPARERRLAAGETLYVVARPDVLRKVEAAAGEETANRTAADAGASADAVERPNGREGRALARPVGQSSLPCYPSESNMQWKLFADLAEVAGSKEVEVDAEPGETVGAALDALVADRPALADRIYDDSGGLRDHINVLRNGTNVHNERGLETELDAGDELALFPPVSGG